MINNKHMLDKSNSVLKTLNICSWHVEIDVFFMRPNFPMSEIPQRKTLNYLRSSSFWLFYYEIFKNKPCYAYMVTPYWLRASGPSSRTFSTISFDGGATGKKIHTSRKELCAGTFKWSEKNDESSKAFWRHSNVITFSIKLPHWR